MSEHDPLGVARGTRGVDQGRQVDVNALLSRRIFRTRLPAQDVIKRDNLFSAQFRRRTACHQYRLQISYLR